MLSDDVILFSFLIPSLYCDFWRQRLEMIFWIFQIQLCIKVILLGTPAQKQRPKPREGAEKCVQDSLRKASRRLDLFKRPRKEKQVPKRGVGGISQEDGLIKFCHWSDSISAIYKLSWFFSSTQTFHAHFCSSSLSFSLICFEYFGQLIEMI